MKYEVGIKTRLKYEVGIKSRLRNKMGKLEYGTKNEIVFWILVGIVFKVKATVW